MAKAPAALRAELSEATDAPAPKPSKRKANAGKPTLSGPKVVPLVAVTPIAEMVLARDTSAEHKTHHKTPNDVDDMLVARAQNGDTRAFEMLMLKHQGRILYAAQRIVGEADAPDATQLAFIKAWRALKDFKGESQFYTWVYRIAINTCKNLLVSRARRSPPRDIEMSEAEEFGHTDSLSENATPERLLLADEIKETVFRVIDRLPHVLKQAITLREIHGLSYDEIAEVEKCPVGTVRSRIFRAREVIDKSVHPLMA